MVLLLVVFLTGSVALLANTNYVVVDVTTDGHHIVIPAPLIALRAAVALAPKEKPRLACPELAQYRDAAQRVVEALLVTPDGELVRVENAEEVVSISKRGETIYLEVHNHEQDVSVNVPLESLLDLLGSYDEGGFYASEVLKALGKISKTDLVHVRTESEEVTVRIQ